MPEPASIDAEALRSRLEAIELGIADAAGRSGRKRGEVTLMAVSKHQPIEAMRAFAALLASRGEIPLFGESTTRELKVKRSAVDFPCRIHMIGALQRNKARDAVRLSDAVQSLHSDAIARELNAEAEKAGKVLPVMLQVNISGDPAKSGFTPEEILAYARETLPSLESLSLAGLMTITRHYDSPDLVRPDYRATFGLWRELSTLDLPRREERIHLSMGMSDDFTVAVEEGATMVRIGTLLFERRERQDG